MNVGLFTFQTLYNCNRNHLIKQKDLLAIFILKVGQEVDLTKLMAGKLIKISSQKKIKNEQTKKERKQTEK